MGILYTPYIVGEAEHYNTCMYNTRTADASNLMQLKAYQYVTLLIPTFMYPIEIPGTGRLEQAAAVGLATHNSGNSC